MRYFEGRHFSQRESIFLRLPLFIEFIFTNLNNQNHYHIQGPTYSVMIYYTPAFEAMEPNIEDYVATIMSELNQGYDNTGVDLSAELHCIAPVNVDDVGSSRDVLDRFEDAFSKSSFDRHLKPVVLSVLVRTN